MRTDSRAEQSGPCPTIRGKRGRPHNWISPEYGRRLYCEYTEPGNPDRVTAETIGIMSELVRGDLGISWFRDLALSVAGSGPPRTQCNRIFAWVKKTVRYEPDKSGPWSKTPAQDDILTGPAELVTCDEPADDCDGFSMLTAALCLAVGIPATFATIAADPAAPQTFTHVYAIAYTAEGPYPLDTAAAAEAAGKNEPEPPAGWEYPAASRKEIWPAILTGRLHAPGDAMQRKRLALRGLGDTDESGSYYDPNSSSSGAGNANAWQSYQSPNTMVPVSTPPFVPSQQTPSSSGLNWNSIINSMFGTAAPILKAQYGTPQLAPGTFYSTSPSGATTMYAVPTGQALTLPGTAAAISSSTLLLVGLAFFGFMLLKK